MHPDSLPFGVHFDIRRTREKNSRRPATLFRVYTQINLIYAVRV